MPHSAFQYEWPPNMHPNGFVFLHPPFDEVRSTCTFDDKQIDALAKHVFDDLGAVLPEFESRQQSITIDVEREKVGEPFDEPVANVTMTIEVTAPIRILGGSLPPGLALVNGRIVGTPAQTGRWKIDLQVGPQYHYQGPLNDGPIGSYNRGSWVDIRTPITFPTAASSLQDLEEDQLESLRTGLAEIDPEKLRAVLAEIDAKKNNNSSEEQS